MALQTRVHRNVEVVLTNKNGIFVSVKRKFPGMTETIFCFVEIFGKKTFRGVTRITSRHILVRTFEPTFILVAHNMAIHAGLWIIFEISIALPIDEGIRAETQYKTNECADQEYGREVYFQICLQIFLTE